MTVLYSPVHGAVFSDEPCWPLTFADDTAISMVDVEPPPDNLHTLVAGIVALHRDENGICTECALNYPCATVKLAQVVARGAV